MRYLAWPQAENNLRVGKEVEQLLTIEPAERGGSIVRWVTVARDEEGLYAVTLLEAFDDEHAASIDLYLLYAVEADQDGAAQPVDAAGTVARFADPEEAVLHVVRVLGGSRDRFLNRGFLSDAYREWKSGRA